VNGRIGNFRDLVESESVRYFEGDSDSIRDLTNLLTTLNFFLAKKTPFKKKATCKGKHAIGNM
jgi:hypothetical protein